jgi:hypothetical protein
LKGAIDELFAKESKCILGMVFLYDGEATLEACIMEYLNGKASLRLICQQKSVSYVFSRDLV